MKAKFIQRTQSNAY